MSISSEVSFFLYKKNPLDILKRVNSYMIYYNIITTSLERGLNDDDDVIDLKTFFFFYSVQIYILLF
jgi:hypothetical protein